MSFVGTVVREGRALSALNCTVVMTWHCDNFTVVNPIVGSFATVDTDLPQIRFVMDPELPVAQGTTRVH